MIHTICFPDLKFSCEWKINLVGFTSTAFILCIHEYSYNVPQDIIINNIFNSVTAFIINIWGRNSESNLFDIAILEFLTIGALLG